MQVYRINTSAYEEEDFYIMTTLSESQIRSVIEPMVHNERVNDEFFENDEYVLELKKKFPREDVRHYSEFEILTF
jgi:hypothetical protein